MTSASEWQAQLGKVWASNSALTDRAFSGLTQRLLERLAREPGDTILDIGCGAGELALALARARPAATVTGVDISPDLVDAARQRDRNLANLHFVLADAASWKAEQAADLLVSRHGVMFFDDPEGAFAHLRDEAAEAATLVFTCFRDSALNLWAHEPLERMGAVVDADSEAPGPFAFASEQRIRAVLTRSGWRDIVVEPVDFAYIAGMGDDPVTDALHFFARIGPAARALREMELAEREEALGRLERWVRHRCSDGLIAFPSAAWMVAARKR